MLWDEVSESFCHSVWVFILVNRIKECTFTMYKVLDTKVKKEKINDLKSSVDTVKR